MKERKITMQRVTIGEQKFIQVLIPDYEGRKELTELSLSNSGNSYNYANTREQMDDLTVQVNCYVKKDTMENVKLFLDSEAAKVRIAQQSETIAKVEKLAGLMDNPEFAKMVAQFEQKQAKAGAK